MLYHSLTDSSTLQLFNHTQVRIMAEAGPKKDVVVIEEEDDDWPEAGTQNPEEAQAYQDKINKVFEDFDELLTEDRKDTLHVTIKSLK